MNKSFGYFDYNSSTPIDLEVLEIYTNALNKVFGNNSNNLHKWGLLSNTYLNKARENVAKYFNSTSQDIVFTSSATEAINLATKGLYLKNGFNKNEIIVSVTEHSAVLESCRYLERFHNAKIKFLNVNSNGQININELKSLISENTLMTCIGLVNNETGIIQEQFQLISEVLNQHSIILMSDITQAVGKININIKELGINIATFSGHKCYAPKGTGAMLLNNISTTSFEPIINGGGQEYGLVSGTTNVPAICALEKAISLINLDSLVFQSNLIRFLENFLIENFNCKINGQNTSRIGNTCNVTFYDLNVKDLIKTVFQFGFSLGSACGTNKNTASHVLLAMGLSEKEAKNSIRISIGKYTTEEEIITFTEALKKHIS